jgi:hypothetical protein
MSLFIFRPLPALNCFFVTLQLAHPSPTANAAGSASFSGQAQLKAVCTHEPWELLDALSSTS